MGAFSLIVVINLLNRSKMPQGGMKFKAKPTGKQKADKGGRNKGGVMRKGPVQIAPKKQKVIQEQLLKKGVTLTLNKAVDEDIMFRAKDERLTVAKDAALRSKKKK